jgi:hypothetical protein
MLDEQSQSLSGMDLFSQALLTMSDIQTRDPIAFGRTRLPDRDVQPLEMARVMRVVRDVSFLGIDSGECLARVAHDIMATTGDKTKPAMQMVTTTSGMVSTSDGWIVSLHETGTAPNFVESTEIRRTTANPC